MPHEAGWGDRQLLWRVAEVTIAKPTSRRKFRPYDPTARLLMPVDLRDWLPEDHLAYVVSDAVDTMQGIGTTALHSAFN